jgi:hypothetical protein
MGAISVKNVRRKLTVAAGLGVMLAVGATAAHASASSQQNTVGIVTIQPGTQGTAFAPCPAGMVATGGGFTNFDALDSTTDVAIAMSRPADNGWQVVAFNATSTPQTVHAQAACAVG